MTMVPHFPTASSRSHAFAPAAGTFSSRLRKRAALAVHESSGVSIDGLSAVRKISVNHLRGWNEDVSVTKRASMTPEKGASSSG
jgi:hypothetical protein